MVPLLLDDLPILWPQVVHVVREHMCNAHVRAVVVICQPPLGVRGGGRRQPERRRTIIISSSSAIVAMDFIREGKKNPKKIQGSPEKERKNETCYGEYESGRLTASLRAKFPEKRTRRMKTMATRP